MLDEAILFIRWGIDAFFIVIKIVFTVIFVLPTLVNSFGIPLEISVFLQAGIYFYYALFYAQWKSGKGFEGYT